MNDAQLAAVVKDPEAWTSNMVPGFRKVLLNEPCIYCGDKSNSLEHPIAKTQGPWTRRKNVVGACYDCNHSRADTPFFIWGIKCGIFYGNYQGSSSGAASPNAIGNISESRSVNNGQKPQRPNNWSILWRTVERNADKTTYGK